MTISFAILGLLTAGSVSGYDLKKVFAGSASLHWSGNSNQIYTTLTRLHRAGLLSREIDQPQEGPARKLYSITDAGRRALAERLRSETDLPEFRSALVARLLGAEVTSRDGREQLGALLAAYAERLRLHLLALEERGRRGDGLEARAGHRAALWRLADEHAEVHYRAELDWVRRVQRAVSAMEGSVS